METNLTGLYAAPHTPMHEDGSLNLDVVEMQARRLIDSGVEGAFLCGSNGEGLSLTVEERMRVAARWRSVAPSGDFNLLVHVGHNCVAYAKQIAEHAEKEIGAKAAAVVAPTYFSPTCVEELVAYCAEIASAAPNTPFYYYHIPFWTALPFKAIDILKEAAQRIPTFAGVKFSNENLMDFKQCLEYDGGRYNVLFGRDEILLSALALGARGAIGATYNFAAPLYHRIIKAYNAGDMAAAQKDQERAMEMVSVLRKYRGIVAIKAAMKAIGIDCGPNRLPLRTLTEDEYAALCRDLERIGFFEYCSKEKEAIRVSSIELPDGANVKSRTER